MGLRPMTWAETLAAVTARLDPPDRDRFTRLHRNFVGYLSPETLGNFYGFVFRHDLHLEVNGFRFERLAAILDILLDRVPSGQSILDIGAGAGLIASVLMKRTGPKTYVMQDPCREVREFLISMGFPVLPDPPPATPPVTPFDLILCIDSLGEIHSDEDGILAGSARTDLEERARLIEERYGFAQKLEPWKSYLAKGGRIFLWEPIPQRSVWEGIAQLLQGTGWNTLLHAKAPGGPYLELGLGSTAPADGSA